MSSILVVVGNEFTAQPPYVRFIYCNHMIRAISAGATDPSFRHSILPRRLYARPFGLQSRHLQEGNHFLIERRVSIEDGLSIRTRFRECFAQLLDDPFRRRVVSHIETQNPASPVVDHKKAESSRSATVGAVKTSNAAITSR